MVYNSSIFDSATDSTVNIPSTSTIVLNDTTTLTSLTSKMDTPRLVPISTSATADDDVDWHESDHVVVMRDKATKQGKLATVRK